jgi:hypothetical protein
VVADGERRRLAFRRRLADGPRQRWAWAVGSGLPVAGVPLLFGLGALASVGFALLTVVGAPRDPSSRSWSPRSGIALLAVLTATGSFALGHKLGQDRAARDAEAWFRLDL